jgi:hypothetical protein
MLTFGKPDDPDEWKMIDSVSASSSGLRQLLALPSFPSAGPTFQSWDEGIWTSWVERASEEAEEEGRAELASRSSEGW